MAQMTVIAEERRLRKMTAEGPVRKARPHCTRRLRGEDRVLDDRRPPRLRKAALIETRALSFSRALVLTVEIGSLAGTGHGLPGAALGAGLRVLRRVSGRLRRPSRPEPVQLAVDVRNRCMARRAGKPLRSRLRRLSPRRLGEGAMRC